MDTENAGEEEERGGENKEGVRKRERKIDRFYRPF